MITNASKVFKHFDRFEALRRGLLMDPVTLEIDLTHACGNHCPWCIDRDLVQGEQELAWDHLEPFLASLAGTGVRSVVLKGGGEPLAHPKASVVMRRLRDLGIEVGLITNGQRLHLHQEAIAACTRWVRVSLSAGSAERYYAIHRPADPDAFATLAENLRRLSAQVRVGTCIVVDAGNCADILETVAFSHAVGCAYVDLKLAHGQGCPPLAPAQRQIMDQQVLEAKARFAGPGFEVFANRLDAQAGAETQPYGLCKAHALVAILGADGNLYACCSTKGNPAFALGSIQATPGFRELWQGPRHWAVMATIDGGSCRGICLGRTSFARYDHYNAIFETLASEGPGDVDFL